MARINVEDSIYRDPRFLKLILKVGCEYKAKGILITAFEMAQANWIEHHGIPAEKWLSDLEVLIDVGLAKRTFGSVSAPFGSVQNELIYVAGSEKQNKWLEQKQAAGRSKSSKKLDAISKNLKRRPNERQTETKRSQTSSSISSSSSSSISNSPSDSSEEGSDEKNSSPLGSNLLVALYCDLWKERYNSTASPPIGGKVAGQIKTLAKDHGPKRAEELIKAYLEMPDQWFVTKRHDVTTLMTNLNAVAQFADNGKMFSRTELRHMDESNALSAQLKRIEEGKI